MAFVLALERAVMVDPVMVLPVRVDKVRLTAVKDAAAELRSDKKLVAIYGCLRRFSHTKHAMF
jgi:hypothetical protein